MTQNEWESGQEVKSNWFKFQKPGDFIKGTLLNKRFQEPRDIYGASWIYELLTSDGTVMNVSVPASKTGTIERLKNCRSGEIIGIMYEKDVQSAKGGKPAKALVVKTWGMDPNYDANMGGVSKEVGEDEVQF